VTPDLARRCALLTAALGFALLDTRGKPAPPKVQTVRRWLDNWTGVGHVVTGMNRQGFRVVVPPRISLPSGERLDQHLTSVVWRDVLRRAWRHSRRPGPWAGSGKLTAETVSRGRKGADY
jgi:hypothetical protein